MKVPLRAQIEELEQQLSERRTEYARAVRRGAMSRGTMIYRLERLEAALKTLRWLHGLLNENERAALPDVIRRACDESGG